ncbi:uncharacterized protein N7511_002606 [Penicillium nucicola]|uniref:uncharacterized protein n=1 Tax=Penicillium nucicola TaxID=1850975 RepID=UPI002544DBED|nr:uncharacterized protein N7511_002606 [Penicillium nucicola]KAJ5770555.1 hypothetical protein N7511_002606 [Penicillium nucicola]
MTTSAQEAFQLLRDPCVSLNAIALGFRSNQGSTADVTRALEPVYTCLNTLADDGTLNSKLANYVFEPLSHIFNQTQRLSARCLELAICSLQILVSRGWSHDLSPVVGKQLIIMCTLIVAGPPDKAQQPLVSEELCIAGFDCLAELFKALRGDVAQQTIFHEIGTATIVDQTVYILLEGVVDTRSDEICTKAAQALYDLYGRITDRVVLASIMPRTVSALTKVLRPTTQIRRSYKLLELCLKTLTRILRAVLNDKDAADVAPPPLGSERIPLDESWLKATTTQIKLALFNVVQVRRHDRTEVQDALLELCTMVIEQCQETLSDSIPLMVETIVVLAYKEDEGTNHAYQQLTLLGTTYPSVLESLKESLHSWLTSFTRVMQGNDEKHKQRALRQISTVFQVLSDAQSGSNLLTTGLASGLCDSLGAVIKESTKSTRPLNPDVALTIRQNDSLVTSGIFPSVVLEHQSQQQTLKDLRSLIDRLNLSKYGIEIAGSIVNRIQATSDHTIAPFWLAITFLRDSTTVTASFDDFISLDAVEQTSPLPSRGELIEKMYHMSLEVLNAQEVVGAQGDWRVSALALEAVALQAQQIGKAFRPELMDALYPVLELMASQNSELEQHAIICLNILTKACNYENTGSMIIANADYLVNAVDAKLRFSGPSPFPASVLWMMLNLCGASLIPYLDDVIETILRLLDEYHGYPIYARIMFRVLKAVVDQGIRKPSMLTIDEGGKPGPRDNRKTLCEPLSISSVVADIAKRKAKRDERANAEQIDADGNISHPKKPWGETYDKPKPEPSIEELLDQAESDEPLPPPKEPEDAEKPLTKTHSLLLHIAKQIPLHLTSPSLELRKTLLDLLTEMIPVLSQNENSFLPLINDLWPAVAQRGAPDSVGSFTQAASVRPRRVGSADTEENVLKDIYVNEARAITIGSMCMAAGDFMASRVEAHFPSWNAWYESKWAAMTLRATNGQTHSKDRILPPTEVQLKGSAPDVDTGTRMSLKIPFNPRLTFDDTYRGGTDFTGDHRHWRSMLRLFLELLEYVRLPVEMGDKICEHLVAWVSLFVGAGYFFRKIRNEAPDINPMLYSVERAILAMEIYNADLTWFLFMKHHLDESYSLSEVTVEEDIMNVALRGKGEDQIKVRLAKMRF